MYYVNHPANDLQLLDRRLVEVYGEAQCLKWKSETPSFLNYHVFELINGHFITDFELIKGNETEPLESLDPVNFPVDELVDQKPSYINPFRYNIKRSFLYRKFYQIANTGKVLVVLSGEELRKKFEG